MKFKITNTKYNDYYIIGGETLEKLKKDVRKTNTLKGWKNDDCFSEELR